jgi:hypothetical protein
MSVSVKNWAVIGTREKVLNILITYWIYGPSQPMCHIHQQIISLSVLLQCLLGERNSGRTRGFLNPTRDGVGRHFSQKKYIYPTLLGQRERLSCMTCHGSVHIMCIRFLLHDVYRFESSRLSDMSNRLSHGYQHVVIS